MYIVGVDSAFDHDLEKAQFKIKCNTLSLLLMKLRVDAVKERSHDTSELLAASSPIDSLSNSVGNPKGVSPGQSSQHLSDNVFKKTVIPQQSTLHTTSR